MTFSADLLQLTEPTFDGDMLKLKPTEEKAQVLEARDHIIRPGVRCCTDTRGYAFPKNGSRLRIVVDSSNGFIPLWKPNTTLRWRFQERSLEVFENPDALKGAVAALLAKGIEAWGNAVPVRFTYDAELWDFEIVIRSSDDCDINGCVLASAFFPDGGQHELVIYPKLFDQSVEEQVETLAHELGHIFGLRHFFAQVSEKAWPSEVFGKHSKFSIMNYGKDSRMTQDDIADLRKLYAAVWANQLTEINTTEIRQVTCFSESGVRPGRARFVATEV
jgi:hypothetical protein